jgi:biotin transport system substrate-specific component
MRLQIAILSKDRRVVCLRDAKKRLSVRDMAFIALFAALTAVCSGLTIALPGTVPFTMQTFAVFAAVAMLGGLRATLCVLVYLLLGAIGLPVFSGFQGGLGVLLGKTGGYLVGFLAIGLTLWCFERLFGRSKWVLPAALIVGLLLCYAFGTAWFLAVYTRQSGAVGLGAVLGWCVWPFVVPDLIKMSLALLLAQRLKKHVRI